MMPKLLRQVLKMPATERSQHMPSNKKIFHDFRPSAIHNPPEILHNGDAGGVFYVNLEKYIERLDQDRRETEERIRNEQQASEQRRVEEQKAMEQRRIEEQKAMEIRRSEERKEFREEMASMRLEMREGFNRLESRIDNVEAKLGLRIDSVEGKLDMRIDSLKWWILGVCLATIVGIAAMVITVVAH